MTGELMDVHDALGRVDEELLYSASTLRNPPSGVRAIFSALLLLMSPRDGVREDVSWQVAQQVFFKRSKSEVTNPAEAQERFHRLSVEEKEHLVSFQKTVCRGFLRNLEQLDRRSVPAANIHALEKYLCDPNFSHEGLSRSSGNLSYLAEFIRALLEYPVPESHQLVIRDEEDQYAPLPARDDKPFSTLAQPGRERTLAMIKPDAVRMGYSDAILKLINLKGFAIVEKVETRLTKDQAKELYWEHKDKPYFTNLLTFVTSGPVVAMVLEKENCIRAWQEAMGNVDSVQAKHEAPDSIRALFGSDNQRNAVHGSSSLAAAQREILFFFPFLVLDIVPDTNLQNWHYLGEVVGVRLTHLMSELSKARPADPYAWMAIYFSGKVPHASENKLTDSKHEYPESVLGDFWGVMKSDHFAGIHRLPGGQRPVPGVPNFRRISDKPIYGVGQPTADGIRAVLDHLTRANRHEAVLWVNLREEPVVYVNGHPFSPRDPNDLNHTVDYLTSIEGRDVEMMERRLKSDLIGLTARQDNRFDYYHQLLDGSNEGREDKVRAEYIKTPRDVYDDLVHAGFNVQYARLPVANVTGPLPQDYDSLLTAIDNVKPGTAIVFNCLAGRGRTTVATSLASLVLEARKKNRELHEATFHKKENNPLIKAPESKSIVNSYVGDAFDLPAKMKLQHATPQAVMSLMPAETFMAMEEKTREEDEERARPLAELVDRLEPGKPRSLPYHASASKGNHNVNDDVTGQGLEDVNAKEKVLKITQYDVEEIPMPHMPERNPNELYERALNGNYKAVHALVNMLVDGRRIKGEADNIIDECAHLTNLRNIIVDCKARSETHDENLSEGRPAGYWLKRGLSYLERYWTIIAFNGYLDHQVAKKTGMRTRTFAEWLEDRWTLRKPLKKLSLD